MSGFDWLKNDSVVISRVDAIAAYLNQDGDVVIRQQDPLGDDDAVIVLPKNRVADLVLALQNLAQ